MAPVATATPASGPTAPGWSTCGRGISIRAWDGSSRGIPGAGVSWFEAEAYGNWLAQKLGKPIRLPTEAEWEKAARGTDGREYPWGDGFERARLNCAEFWAKDVNLDWQKWITEKGRGFEDLSTTIVGQFPEGNSPYDVCDLSGNVWEWTNSWLDKDQIYRVLCGGSFDDNRRDVRCAARNGVTPANFYSNFGFRVVSPG